MAVLKQLSDIEVQPIYATSGKPSVYQWLIANMNDTQRAVAGSIAEVSSPRMHAVLPFKSRADLLD